MGDYFQHNKSICSFSGGDSWIILSDIEQSIKEKIEQVGTPLKDWDIQINYGIKTGCNEAFIINGDKRKEILDYCENEAEYQRTDELIRPILRGRDVKRYSYSFADLYLINTHNGVKGKFPRIDIEDYPAVKHWLDNGGIAYNGHLFRGYAQIAKRDDQGDTPYNLRNCAYMEDFFKQKIVWARLMRLSKDDINNFPRFSFVVSKYFVVDSLCFFTGSAINYLIGILNSEFAKYYFFNNVAVLDNGGMQMRQQYIEQIPIPSADNSQMESIIQATKLSDYNLVDNIVNQLWKFSTEEIKAIKECIKEKEYAIINDLKR